MDKPEIIFVKDKGWLVKFPDGNYSYQPSKEFAEKAAAIFIHEQRGRERAKAEGRLR